MATQCSLSDASKQINLNIWSFLRRLTSYEVAFDCATYHFLHGTAAVAQYSPDFFLSRTCSASPGCFNTLMMPEGIKDITDKVSANV